MNRSRIVEFLIQRWYLSVGALAVAAVLAWSFQPRAIPVQVTSIDRGLVRSTLIDEGRTRMHETYVVSAPVAGALLRVDVEPGDEVTKGETLARLMRNRAGFLDARSDSSSKSMIEAAESQLRAAIAAREYATNELDRAQKLADSKLVAQSVLEGAKTRLRTAKAEEALARAEVSRARSALLSAESQDTAASMPIRAPASGYILEVPQQSESAIQIGTPIVVLGDPTRIDIVAEFLSQDALRIEAGDTAFIENWSTDESASRPIRARVERIEPTARTKISALGIEEQRTRVILSFIDEVPAALRAHQYRVDARIVIDQVEQAVRVPLGALFRDGNNWSVFAVRDGRAWSQRVTLGIRGDEVAEIKEGLSPGDRVVLFPNRELSSGMSIELEEQR